MDHTFGVAKLCASKLDIFDQGPVVSVSKSPPRRANGGCILRSGASAGGSVICRIDIQYLHDISATIDLNARSLSPHKAGPLVLP